MKIVVKLAKSLVPSIENRLLDNQQLSKTTVKILFLKKIFIFYFKITPFTRIVFIFSHDNTKFLTALTTCIRTINAKALDFDQHPVYVQIAALSRYKLTE